MTITINGTTGIAGVDGSAGTPAVQGADTNTGVFFGTDTVTISTGGTAAVTVDSGQRTKFPTTIGVGGATPSTSGSGISFPATQSASSDANTLDDYEEGTSSALTVTCGSGTASLESGAPGYNTVAYTKIGRQVTVTGRLAFASVSSASGSLKIDGLPFAPANTQPTYTAVAIYGLGLTGATKATPLQAEIRSNETSIRITRLLAGVETNDIAGSLVTNTSELRVSATYFIA